MVTLLKTKLITAVVLILASSLVLSGCGRNGMPIRPSDAAIKQAKEDELPAPETPTPNANNPQKRFILDGLLE